MTELYAYLRGRMRAHPNRTVRDESRFMTFVDLFEEAERLGASLTGRLYGVLCRSDLDTARWILACLSAGKTAVPLSRRYGARARGRHPASRRPVLHPDGGRPPFGRRTAAR